MPDESLDDSQWIRRTVTKSLVVKQESMFFRRVWNWSVTTGQCCQDWDSSTFVQVSTVLAWFVIQYRNRHRHLARWLWRCATGSGSNQDKIHIGDFRIQYHALTPRTKYFRVGIRDEAKSFIVINLFEHEDTLRPYWRHLHVSFGARRLDSTTRNFGLKTSEGWLLNVRMPAPAQPATATHWRCVSNVS